MNPAFEIIDGRIETERGPLLRDLNLSFEPDETVAILGPAGTGKSALLSQLAGRPLPAGWTRSGRWLCRGEPVAQRQDLCLVSQTPRELGAAERAAQAEVLERALYSDAAMLLLDEPLRGVSESARAPLRRALAESRGKRTTLLITHNLSFAREASDRVLLFCAGRLEAWGPTEEVFDRPPTSLSERFMQQGNCWPEAQPPPLPSHFRWLWEGKLAGMGRPGLLGSVERDLEAIAHAGISVLISLTINPAPASALRSIGIEGRHLPIQDMGIPGTGPLLRVLAGMKRSLKAGNAIAVHCDAGIGRTGTVLAAYLIYEGASAEEAIETVRAVNPTYIQSQSQMDFLGRFAEDQ